ncbi:unnamed protein product [Pseudo-nitzschia multistriata]|uniref:Nucleotide-diphospho-sugar transferase domain-containing protein n=1 Tax=Pseudo-nitzschia multistriata TaxID=183589 RepID=A0A448ZKJ6_9STRA|nr:unnamed protein product [Pseudo-nitzschia multistriata]
MLLQHRQPQVEGRSTATRFVVYFLTACSAGLLFNSWRLERFRIESLVRNAASKISSSRALPEENHNQDIVGGEVGGGNGSELYVPSLDYRIKGISQYSSKLSKEINFDAHVYCKEFENDLIWEWWQPSKENAKPEQIRHLRKEDKKHVEKTTKKRNTRKRLLIGVSGGYDKYSKLLERAVWSARVYAALWSGGSSKKNNSDIVRDTDVTVVTLQGTAFSPHGCKAPSAHSSINKIRLLFEAIDAGNQYDQMLLLDPDTMIYDMETDLTTLIGDKEDFVVAGPAILTEEGKKDKYMPWKITSGITLWNLEHPSTKAVALDWFRYAKNAIIRETYQSDQKYLLKALKNYYNTNSKGVVARSSDREGIVKSLMNHQFDDGIGGRFVKQFRVQKKAKNPHDKQVEARLARMEETAGLICEHYPDACDRVGKPPRYESS